MIHGWTMWIVTGGCNTDGPWMRCVPYRYNDALRVLVLGQSATEDLPVEERSPPYVRCWPVYARCRYMERSPSRCSPSPHVIASRSHPDRIPHTCHHIASHLASHAAQHVTSHTQSSHDSHPTNSHTIPYLPSHPTHSMSHPTHTMSLPTHISSHPTHHTHYITHHITPRSF